MDAIQKRGRRQNNRIKLKYQWRPSQSRKESILNCLLMGKRCFKGRDRIRKCRTSRKRAEHCQEVKCGSENNGRLLRWTYNRRGKGSQTVAACLKRFWAGKAKNIITRRKGKMNVYYDSFFLSITPHIGVQIFRKKD